MKGEKGFSLLEVVIAMLLLGIVGAAFLGGLATASRGIFYADERATAESLARTQMEYIRTQEYDGTNDPPQYAELPGSDVPDGYEIEVSAERLDRGDGTANDTGIQKITVTVYFPSYDATECPGRMVVLEGYRSWRG